MVCRFGSDKLQCNFAVDARIVKSLLDEVGHNEPEDWLKSDLGICVWRAEPH
jgi:hypothetical protein